MYSKAIFALALLAATLVSGHMHLDWPPALKGMFCIPSKQIGDPKLLTLAIGDNNPFTKTPDQYLNYPYGCCGLPVKEPCHGHLGILDTEEGTPVVE
jgi:hypothetical protein